MDKKAIVIGAGQIGRGFIGERLADSGYEIIFLDVNENLINEINTHHKYRVIILGETEHQKMIQKVRAVYVLDSKAPYEILDADIITTAVGPKAIPAIAPLIAEGIRIRYREKSMKPLTVIACENMNSGTTNLYNSVKAFLNEAELEYCNTYAGFPDAEVSRIVVPIDDKEKLTVKVEKYMEWIIDRAKVKGDLSDIKGLMFSDRVEAYVHRKIFTLTGHAMLGYLGYQKGHDHIWQSVNDPEIFKIVYGALKECALAWSKKYQMPVEEFMEYSSFMLIRFADQRIQDPCIRPCREPIRKLAVSERFFSPALTAIEFEIEPKNIVKGIKAALAYDYAGDQEALNLQSRRKEIGDVQVLAEITGLETDHKLLQMMIS